MTDALMDRLLQFMPVFIRVFTFITATPLFRRNAPILVIIGLSAFMTAILFPLVPVPVLDLDWHYAQMIIHEIGFGLVMGLVVTVFFYAVYVAGQLMDVPMGFGMVNILDPQIGLEVPVMAQFHFILAMIFFFAANGHHMLLRSLAASFTAAPIGLLGSLDLTYDIVAQAVGAMFVYGFRIGLPVIGALFVTDVLLGVTARTVPQINVFFFGFPIKAALGFFILILALPAFAYIVSMLLSPGGAMFRSLAAIIRLVGSGP